MECFWFCFAELIQQDLDFVKNHWNTHTIRTSSRNTIPGKPDELFLFPKNKGGEHRLHPVTLEEIEVVAENLLQFDEEVNWFQDYFHYLFTNINIRRPTSWMDALNLYRELMQIFSELN